MSEGWRGAGGLEGPLACRVGSAVSGSVLRQPCYGSPALHPPAASDRPAMRPTTPRRCTVRSGVCRRQGRQRGRRGGERAGDEPGLPGGSVERGRGAEGVGRLGQAFGLQWVVVSGPEMRQECGGGDT